jgi:integrase
MATQVTGRLSDARIRRAKATSRKPDMLPDGKGLYLRVTGGSKSWIFRYALNRERHDYGIGPYPEISLADARERRQELRALCKNGHDPLADRRHRRAAAGRMLTFRQCAEAYITAHESEWKSERNRQQWTSTLTADVFATLGDVPVDRIDDAAVLAVLTPIWEIKNVTASRIRGRIENILDYAKSRKLRAGENPARWTGHLEHLLAKPKSRKDAANFAAMPYAKVPAFMAELRKKDGIAERALELAILTAARSGEVIGARWSEVDLDKRLWIVPKERMKARQEHRIPLCGRAIEILEGMAAIRGSAYVFPGTRVNRPLGPMALRRALQGIAGAGVTVHGFRSAFTDWAAEQTNFPAEARQMALAHTVSDAVEAAYRRGDLFKKRRRLAEAWARFCADPVDNIEELPQRRASRR